MTVHDSQKIYLQQKTERIDRVGHYLMNHVLPSTKLHKTNQFNLEIGSGHGHWLTSYACNVPSEVFVGIDLISKRVKKSETKKKNHKLKNVFFIKAEVSEFLQSLPECLKINSTIIMFPDPWPKKRHFKNRIIQNDFLTSLSQISSRTSKLFFRTDDKPYFDWTTNIIQNHNNWELCLTEWPHESNSFFQDLFNDSFTCTARILA
jgi:tRNA (guanine-N7-)-methyltransferase